jgi:hypothetical protein
MCVDRSVGDIENYGDLPGRPAVGHPLQHLDLAQRHGIGPFAPREPERPIKRMPDDVLIWPRGPFGRPGVNLHIEARRDIVIVDRDKRVRVRHETAVGISG